MRSLAGNVLLVFVVVLVAGCSSEQVVPFDFDTDDLCEWIDADTVSKIVADAYTEHGASPVPTGFDEARPSGAHEGCWWAVPEPDQGSDPGELRLSEVGLIRTDPLDVALSGGWVFDPHPALSDGVRVGPGSEVVGAYGEWVCGMEVRLSVEGQDDTVEFWHCVPPDFDGDANAILGIADGLLREMGWVPVSTS